VRRAALQHSYLRLELLNLHAAPTTGSIFQAAWTPSIRRQ
jgi:hypothetical protein